MLLTTCSNCAAQFKVLPEHLNVRQGRVMCGRCRHVFNAFESLKRVEDDPLPPFAATVPLSTIPPAETPYGAAHTSDPIIYTQPDVAHAGELDIEFVSEPEFSAPQQVADVWAPAPTSSTASPAPLADKAAVEDDMPRPFHAHEPEPPPERAGPISTLGAMRAIDPIIAALAPATIAAPPEAARHTIDSHDMRANYDRRVEPELDIEKLNGPPSEPPLMMTDPPEVRDTGPTYVTEPPSTKRWTVLASLMGLLFVGLLLFQFRQTLTQSYPQLRPAFASVCGVIGCKLSWGRDPAVIQIASAELVETPGKPGKLIASAIIANRGAAKQDLPSIELRLTNNTNQVLISRILEPRDYLGRAVTADDGINANAEFVINLNIEIPPTTAASGYEFLPFYH